MGDAHVQLFIDNTKFYSMAVLYLEMLIFFSHATNLQLDVKKLII